MDTIRRPATGLHEPKLVVMAQEWNHFQRVRAASLYASWAAQLVGRVRTLNGVPSKIGMIDSGINGWKAIQAGIPEGVYDPTLWVSCKDWTPDQLLGTAAVYGQWASQLSGDVWRTLCDTSEDRPVRTVLMGRRLKLPSTAILAN